MHLSASARIFSLQPKPDGAAAGTQPSRGKKSPAAAASAPAEVDGQTGRQPEASQIDVDLLAASVLSTVDVKKANVIKILDQIQQQAGRSLTEEETKKARAAVLEGLANMEAAQTLEPRTEEIAQAMTKQLLKQCLTIKPLHRLRTINPDKPVFCAASASDKKTCLIEATTDFMTKSNHAPREIKKSTVFAVDGSVRGLREAIVQYHKVSCTTDEVVTMIATPWSESGTSNVLHLKEQALHVLTGRA